MIWFEKIPLKLASVILTPPYFMFPGESADAAPWAHPLGKALRFGRLPFGGELTVEGAFCWTCKSRFCLSKGKSVFWAHFIKLSSLLNEMILIPQGWN
ncbi:MAG: hypothetical protein WHS46_10215 [Desulfosoma sp.]